MERTTESQSHKENNKITTEDTETLKINHRGHRENKKITTENTENTERKLLKTLKK